MRAERCEKARANSRVTKAAFWALIGLATSMSLGTVGTFAVGSGRASRRRRTAGRRRRRSRLLQGHPLRGASRGRPAVAPAAAGGEVDGRAPGSGIRSGLHAGTVRAASGCARRCASGSGHYARARSPTACSRARRSGSVGGLPVSERLASGRSGRPQSARDGLDLWRRVHGRLERVAQHVGRRVRQAGRRPCRHELPRGALRLFRVSGVEQRASGRDQGQLRLHGPDRRLAVGASGTSPPSEAIRTTSPSLGFPRVASPFTACWRRRRRAACSTRRSSSPAAPGTACSPPGRCVRTALIRTIRCRPRRSGPSSRNRWGSKARTRPLWPSLRAPQRRPGSSRRSGPARDQRAVVRDDADPRRQTDHRNGRDRLQGPAPAARAVAAWQQQRRYRRQPGTRSHQGGVLRAVRPMERRGEGGLRS